MSLIQGMLEEEYGKMARQMTDFLRGPVSSKQQRVMAALREDIAFIENAFAANQAALPGDWRCNSQTEIIYSYPAVLQDSADEVQFWFPDLGECRGAAANGTAVEKLAAEQLAEELSCRLQRQELPPAPSASETLKAALAPRQRIRMITAGKPYTVIQETEATGVKVFLPELPGCSVAANTEEEALAALTALKAEWLDQAFRERKNTRRQGGK